MDRNLLIIRTHIEELRTNCHAVEQWLRDNEPVRAFEAIRKIEEKIDGILKEIDEKYDKGVSIN